MKRHVGPPLARTLALLLGLTLAGAIFGRSVPSARVQHAMVESEPVQRNRNAGVAQW